MKTIKINPELYAKYLAQIPTRFLYGDRVAPPGRKLFVEELGRPLTPNEKYRVRKWRKQGISETKIKRKLIERNKQND